MMIKFTDKSDRPTLVPGDYVGELVKIEYHPTEQETAQGVVPQFGPYLTFLFKVVEPAQFANALRSGICSAKRDPRSKLTIWLKAFGLNATEIGAELDEALLVGKQVRLRMDMDKNQQLKITAIGPVNGAPPVAVNAPVGFKPASRPPSLATPAPRPALVQQSSVPTPLPKPSTPTLPPANLDDIPF